jgi:hypothetical protein
MTMPAGRYYIGDLCYVMHPEWSECCDLFFPPGSSSRGVDGEFGYLSAVWFVRCAGMGLGVVQLGKIALVRSQG